MAKLISRAALAAAAMALGLSGAHATTTATGTLNVSLTVAASCTVGASSLSFGSVTGIGDTPVATGTINVTCTPGTSFSVDLNNGAHYDSTAHKRNMAGSSSSAHMIAYDLYSDKGASQAWTAQTPTLQDSGIYNIGITSIAHLGTNGAVVDNYSDQVTITVTY